ncbi:MAG: hypothetical protein QF600_04800 [Verrucomicrobiota bacterium]|nr:hypothetical protein [Verrucomicrobiota bacterium]
MKMYLITILFGVLLVITGVTVYIQTGSEHKTALIPAFLGGGLVICGLLAANEARRMMIMHVAVMIGLLGFIGSMAKLFKSGQSNAAFTGKAISAGLCAVFITLCVRSFIQARRAREAVVDEADSDVEEPDQG